MAKRVWGALLALIAAGLLVTAALSKSWWRMSEGDESAGMGPLGVEMCHKSECKSGDLPDKGSFRTLGWGAFGGALGAGVLAMLAGFVALARKTTRAFAIFGLVFSVVALGAACAFVFGAPGKEPTKGLAWAFYVVMGGGVLGIVGCALINAWAKNPGGFVIPAGVPANVGARTLISHEAGGRSGADAATIAPGMQPPVAAPPPRSAKGAAMVPPCPRCHGPLQYAAQFKSWYCPRCNSYVSA